MNEARDFYTKLTNKTYHAFFAVEAQCSYRALLEMENQCICAGSAMLYARRLLNEEADDTFRPRPDLSSFVFTLALHPSKSVILVHWAECMLDKQVTYHSHVIESYDFFREDSFEELGQDLNNVLDWGVSI